MSSGACRTSLRSATIVCVLLAGATAASAGEPAQERPGFWTSVLERLDVKTKPATMPDFVRATRPDADHLTFVPTGPMPREQAVPVKSADEIEAAKAALDAAQATQLRPRATAPAGKAAKPRVKAAR